MKISILSDIHEGLNRKNTKADVMGVLKKWSAAHLPDVFITSGDIAAGPEKSLALLNQLQSEFPQTKVLFVHGNHDIYHENSKFAYETLLEFPGNLGNGPVELCGIGWLLVMAAGMITHSGSKNTRKNNSHLVNTMPSHGQTRFMRTGQDMIRRKQNDISHN
ncbi:metallophosphoesterase [Neobacillus sp. NPDC097160]|uniref:metallophosphoesterase n=1 Tax=Neobacillus sp. NPDC097160 TaxID=3364298 RepID=UPI0037FF9F07